MGDMPVTDALDVETFDLVGFHRDVLPERLADGNGALAAVEASWLGSIAFAAPSGAWTLGCDPDDNTVVVIDGVSDDARTVVEMDDASLTGLCLDLDTPVAMLYQDRARVTRGKALRFIRWEPALRAAYHGRPIYDAEALDLRDRDGQPIDPAASLTLDEVAADPEAMAHRLSAVGFAMVRSVFTAEEVTTMLVEAEQLLADARPDDRRSWWGRTADGEHVVTRVLDAAKQRNLGRLYDDRRVQDLVAACGLELRNAKRFEVDGVTVLWKRPGVVEGLSDLPWHRDCGMGGHARNCPTVVMSICLTDGGPEAGELRALPGSHTTGHPFIDGTDNAAPPGVALAVTAGDLSLHSSDVMHASLPPTSVEGPHRISVLLAFTQPAAGHHRGGRHYNDAIFTGDGGQVEHLGHKLAAG